VTLLWCCIQTEPVLPDNHHDVLGLEPSRGGTAAIPRNCIAAAICVFCTPMPRAETLPKN
jgi:hypothetical protein